jgi:hypothetical protein
MKLWREILPRKLPMKILRALISIASSVSLNFGPGQFPQVLAMNLAKPSYRSVRLAGKLATANGVDEQQMMIRA